MITVSPGPTSVTVAPVTVATLVLEEVNTTGTPPLVWVGLSGKAASPMVLTGKDAKVMVLVPGRMVKETVLETG